MAIQNNIDYESTELKPVLESLFKNVIKEQMDKTIKKCQGLNIDVFKFGAVAAMHFPTVEEWEEYITSEGKKKRVATIGSAVLAIVSVVFPEVILFTR